VAESFCSHCGVDLIRQLESAQESLDARLAKAAQLEAEGKLLEAFDSLADVAEHDHSRLASRLQEIRRRRTELSGKRTQAISERATLFEKARRLQQTQHFAAAYATLERVPASLRDLATRELLAELEQPLAEIKQLRASLAQALKNEHPEGGLPIAERLHQLEPHADDVRRVCEQLRLQRRQRNAVLAKQLLAEARDAISTNDYVKAGDLIDQTPPPEDETDRKLFAAIEERVWLVRQLTTAPFADETLLRMAERFSKLQPKDASARKLPVEIAARLERTEPRVTHPYVPWARKPGKTALGAPIEPISGVNNIHWDPRGPRVMSWVSHLRRNLVALGLALTGLGDAPLADMDFRWRTASSWLGRLTGGGRRRSSAAWGLDFGTRGLKFVHLVCHRGAIELDSSGMISYGREAASPELPDIQSLLAPAFEKFCADQSPGDEPMVVGFPGVQTLGRFFTLPLMKGKKLQTALSFEVENQIPLPPDEVIYAAHCWSGAAGMHSVAVAAAKQAQVALRAGPFADRNPRALSLQSDCIALLNVLLHCYVDEIALLKPADAIALIELGDAVTNIVAVSPGRGPWFRAIHRGMRSLNRSLVDAFGVTWQQADTMRQQWPGPRPMAAVDQALAPAILDLTRDVRHVLRACEEALAAKIVRIHVAGGGCDQFGLLRNWSRCDDGEV
jgi:Tfp pilus assembly PilM family ATPase